MAYRFKKGMGSLGCDCGVEDDAGNCTPCTTNVIGPPVINAPTPAVCSAGTYLSAGNTCLPNPAPPTTYAACLAMYSDESMCSPTQFGAAPASQTFAQWISANSTILLVSFAAIGALMALAGKK